MMETSAIWVGLTRTVVIICAHRFTYFAFYSIPQRIEEPLSSSCVCQCLYTLHPWDFLKFLFAAYALTLINMLFIKSWSNETHFEHYFLYLISHSVSVWISDAVNKEDLTASLIKEQNQVQNLTNLKLRIQADSGVMVRSRFESQLDLDSLRHENENDGEIDLILLESKRAAIHCRGWVYIVTWFYSVVYVAGGLIFMAFYK